MKGISVKKLAALGISSVMALSLGFAGAVSYEGTQLVNDNGVPQVTVVVGEKGLGTDGVAAAKIAAYLASKANKATTLSAVVKGTPTCSVTGGSGTGAGTCPVTDKSVVLEVQLPGEAGGTYRFTTLIDDYADRQTENRVRSNAGTDRWDSSSSELGSNNKYDFPFYNDYVNPNSFLSISNLGTFKEGMVRVSGSDLTALRTNSVVDERSAKRWEQRQYLWFAGYNKFDDLDDNNNIKLRPELFAYSTKFFGVSGVSADAGIPVCTDDQADQGYLAGCSTSDNYYIGNHRVRIKFMGEDWVITAMSPPSAKNLTADGDFEFGGSVTLAKESKYGILNVGGAPLEAEDIKVRLGDISLATGQDNVHYAILDILDSSDQVIQQTQVKPGQSTEVLTPSGSKVKIRVYQTAPGFTLTQKWAELAVVKDEKTLRDGQQVDATDNKNYYVKLKWVNDLKPSNVQGGTNGAKADSLREITVYRETFDADTYSPGSEIPMMVKPAQFKLKYVGVDLDKSKDYADLTFKLETRTLSGVGVVNSSRNDNSAVQSVCNTTVSYTSVPVLTIRSSEKVLKPTSSFGGQFALPTEYDTFYVVLNASSNNDRYDVIYPLQNQLTCTSGSTASFGAYDYNGSDTAINYVWEYKTAGTQASIADGGLVILSLPKWSTTDRANLTVIEDSGKWDTDSYEGFNWTASFTITDGSTKFYQTATGTDVLDNNIYYGFTRRIDGNVGYTSVSSPKLLKVNQLSHRGSYLSYSSESDLRLKIAKGVARLKFEVAAAGTAARAANEETLREGDERDWAGVKVKVKKINCEVGGCTVTGAGAPTCTVDSSGVRAAIVDAAGNELGSSVQSVVPASLPSGMVVLDSASPSGLVISVGGPAVNTVTERALAGSVDFNQQRVVVRKQGNVIVVAGLTGQDTMAAADQFLASLQSS
ncbi:MAG: hypothetical protein N3E37_01230 [Candidatus Micrarchaeota archaeon]|nr:hypothetical protein [Candidatus Micrarchaeota archaeon]